jgi:hypothetical protein
LLAFLADPLQLALPEPEGRLELVPDGEGSCAGVAIAAANAQTLQPGNGHALLLLDDLFEASRPADIANTNQS